MATVYLCIGTQKTGTTSLQYFMRANEAALKKQGYCYPYMDIGIPDAYYKNRNAHFLVYHSADSEEEKRKKEKAYQILGGLAEEYENIVLSDEIIWYQCNKIKHFWETISEEFKKINCELKIVVYLRRQDAMIQSLWNQKVKGLPGITEDFQTYFQKKMYQYFPLDYYAHLQKIAGYVGKENMLVRVYENGQFGGKDENLLSDYLDTLGIDFNEEFVVAEETLNHGLDGNFVEMKRILNGIEEYQGMDNFMRMPMTYASDAKLNQNPQKKTSMFIFEEQVEFLKQFEESNTKVAKEYLGRGDGVLFREPVQELPTWNIENGEMYQDLFAVMAEMFCAQEKKINNLKKDIRAINNSLIFRGYRKAKKMLKNK